MFFIQQPKAGIACFRFLSLKPMKKNILLIALALPTYLVFPQDPEKNMAPVNLQITYKASERPDRVILTWEENNLSTQTVTWRTDGQTPYGTAELALVTKKANFYKEKESYPAETVKIDAIDETVHYHKVTFKNLKPGVYYAYRVGYGQFWSEWVQFKTPEEHFTNPFEFIYLGDAQNDLHTLWSRVAREAYQASPKARFIIHAGDLINHSENNYEWGEWFTAAHPFTKMVPQIAAPGNHEYIKNKEGRKIGLTPLWNPQFNFPKNGPPALEDTVFYIDYLNCRIITLNSNENIEEQALWLENVLKGNNKTWVIVTFHHPLISAAQGRANDELMKLWKPLLDNYRVDLVLQGHDHVYGRGSNLNSGLNLWDENSGTVYVVSVSGRKMYPLSNHTWMEKKGENMQLYQVLTVYKNKILYKAYTTDNEVFDAFEIKKRHKKTNKFKELH